MKKHRRVRDRFTVLGLALALSGCGGGSGSTASGGGGPIVSPTPTPTPSTTGCALRARQDWALAQVNEWYLFPETLSFVPPNAFSNVYDYVDALTAGARAQGKDRYFSYVTSIAAEEAYYNSGETAGFGFRIHTDANARRLWVSEAFEGAPALAAGVDRGAEIMAIGTSSSNMRLVSDILLSGGGAALSMALGSDLPGTTRVFDIQDKAGRRLVTISKADFAIQPVSPRYGISIIDDGGRKVGYVNLRTFINTARPQLRDAFAQFKAQGVQDVIVDLRYNGGGLVSVAQTFGSLLGAARHPTDIVAQLRFRPEKSAENDSYYFQSEANSIAPRRIAFIGTEATASASEMLMNGFRPYLPNDIALIGEDTYGKPVGQIALDKPECDDRLRLIAFATVNANGQGGYFDGIASIMPATCRAEDDLDYPLGDPREESVARALDYLNGRPCSAIASSAVTRTASASTSAVAPTPDLKPLVPSRPSQPQREMPGLF